MTDEQDQLAEIDRLNRLATDWAEENTLLEAKIKRLTEDLAYANAELLRYSSCLYGGNPDCPARPVDFEDVPGATARPPLAGKQEGFETLGPSLQVELSRLKPYEIHWPDHHKKWWKNHPEVDAKGIPL